MNLFNQRDIPLYLYLMITLQLHALASEGIFPSTSLKDPEKCSKTRCFTYQNKAELTGVADIHMSPSVIAMERRKIRKTKPA